MEEAAQAKAAADQGKAGSKGAAGKGGKEGGEANKQSGKGKAAENTGASRFENVCRRNEVWEHVSLQCHMSASK